MNVDVSICVCTFRRPVGLRRLLGSLALLDGESPTYEVIVVDNDGDAGARAVVDEFDGAGLALRYTVEPIQNISRARNASIAGARGSWIAFVDDDEWVEPDWLARLFATMAGARRRNGAVIGAMGLVEPAFAAPVPEWVEAGGSFAPRTHLSGAALPWWDLSTGNVLLHAETLRNLDQPFDPAYGLTGGEDSDLFVRLLEAGGVVVAAPDAVVFESIPAGRTSYRWLARRQVRNGVIATRVETRSMSASTKIRYGFASIGRGLQQLARGLLHVRADRSRALPTTLEGLVWFGRAAGITGWDFESYRSPEPEAPSTG